MSEIAKLIDTATHDIEQGRKTDNWIGKVDALFEQISPVDGEVPNISAEVVKQMEKLFQHNRIPGVLNQVINPKTGNETYGFGGSRLTSADDLAKVHTVFNHWLAETDRQLVGSGPTLTHQSGGGGCFIFGVGDWDNQKGTTIAIYKVQAPVKEGQT